MSKLSAKVLGVLLACSFLVGGCGTDYKAELEKAEKEFKNGNYQQAKEHYITVAGADDAELKKIAETALEDYENKAAEHKRRIENVPVVFDDIMARNLASLYQGSTVKDKLQRVDIYVSPLWYSLNDGYKKAFVSKSFEFYHRALKIKQLEIEDAKLNILIKDVTTNETVAKWNSIVGISID